MDGYAKWEVLEIFNMNEKNVITQYSFLKPITNNINFVNYIRL